MKNSFLYFFGRKCKRGYKSDTPIMVTRMDIKVTGYKSDINKMVTSVDIKVTLTKWLRAWI